MNIAPGFLLRIVFFVMFQGSTPSLTLLVCRAAHPVSDGRHTNAHFL